MQKTEASLDDILKTIIFDVILKVVISKLIARFAFLGLPIINPILGMVLSWFAQEIFEQISKFFRFTAIDSKIAGQVEGYDDAVADLKAALELPLDDEERESVIDEAKENYKQRLADLIRIPTAA